MNRLLFKSMLFALFLFAGAVANGGQPTKVSAEDVFEITHGDTSDVKKPSKYKSLIDIQSAVLLSELNDDVVYIEIKVHNKSKQDVVIWGKDVKAGSSMERIHGDRGFDLACPRPLEVLGQHFPLMIKPDHDAVFILSMDQIKRWDEFNIFISFFDLSEDIKLKKK